MEYAKVSKMYGYLITHRKIGEQEAKAKFRHILFAVKYWHDKGIGHRLNTKKILLNEDINIKIPDFGGV